MHTRRVGDDSAKKDSRSRSRFERRREFATLRAIGGSEGQIRQLVLWEAAYLGVVGIALGLVGGGLLSLLLIKVIKKSSPISVGLVLPERARGTEFYV